MFLILTHTSKYDVALRKESVDRNLTAPVVPVYTRVSLSARRAWIEILLMQKLLPLRLVALRKESVDRNVINRTSDNNSFGSLSARRAWIEIVA